MSNQPTDAPTIHVVYKGEYEDRHVVCAAPTLADAERIAHRLGGDDVNAFVDEIPIHTGDVLLVSVLTLTVNVHLDSSSYGRDVKEWVNSYIPKDIHYQDDVKAAWSWMRVSPMQGRRPTFWSLRAWGTDHDRVRRVFAEVRDKLASDPEYRDQPTMEGAEHE